MVEYGYGCAGCRNEGGFSVFRKREVVEETMKSEKQSRNDDSGIWKSGEGESIPDPNEVTIVSVPEKFDWMLIRNPNGVLAVQRVGMRGITTRESVKK